MRQNLTIFKDWHGFNPIWIEDVCDFMSVAFVVWINEVKSKKLITTNVILVPLNLVTADFSL